MTPIIRVVKLTLKREHQDDFVRFFKEHQSTIEGHEGCHSVELHKTTRDEGVFFTLSLWDSEEALDDYRNSSFFKTIWPQVKLWLSEKTEAYSLIRKQ